jgi:hypothetical protein
MPKGKPRKAGAETEQWRKLTPKEVDLVLTNETTFAEYVATLSVEQIDAYLLQLKSDTSMEKASRASFVALLEHVRKERIEADTQAAIALGPLVLRAETVVALDEQIVALEKIIADVESV